MRNRSVLNTGLLAYMRCYRTYRPRLYTYLLGVMSPEDSAFDLLVKLILSIRSKDSTNLPLYQQIRATHAPFKIYLLSASIGDIAKLIYKSGLSKQKAHSLKAVAIYFKYYKYPSIRRLKTVKGVGDKIIDVYQHALYKKPRIAVDTHLWAIAQLLGPSTCTNIKQAQKWYYTIFSKKVWYYVHILLIPVRKYGCVSRLHNCPYCPHHPLTKLILYRRRSKS